MNDITDDILNRMTPILRETMIQAARLAELRSDAREDKMKMIRIQDVIDAAHGYKS